MQPFPSCGWCTLLRPSPGRSLGQHVPQIRLPQWQKARLSAKDALPGRMSSSDARIPLTLLHARERPVHRWIGLRSNAARPFPSTNTSLPSRRLRVRSPHPARKTKPNRPGRRLTRLIQLVSRDSARSRATLRESPQSGILPGTTKRPALSQGFPAQQWQCGASASCRAA